MKINREMFIDDTGGSIDELFNIVDSLLVLIEHYQLSDESAGMHGAGCFTDPQGEIERVMKDNDIIQYIDFK